MNGHDTEEIDIFDKILRQVEAVEMTLKEIISNIELIRNEQVRLGERLTGVERELLARPLHTPPPKPVEGSCQ
jgi:hypothetical protein